MLNEIKEKVEDTSGTDPFRFHFHEEHGGLKQWGRCGDGLLGFLETSNRLPAPALACSLAFTCLKLLSDSGVGVSENISYLGH